MDLRGKVVAITGGGRGIGRAMALAFAGKGAHVALLDLNVQDMQTTQAQCEALGVRSLSHSCNVARETDVATALDNVIASLGRLDVLINNAGITKDALLVKVKDGQVVGKMSLEQWQSVIDVNLTGVFLCTREAVARMIQLGNGGCIISLSSISRAGNVGQSNYGATKAGVVAMTSGWAKELSRYKIRTGAIAPGFTRTDILDAMKPEILDRMLETVPARRLAEPTEMAHAALFIAENDYFSGRVLELDGGLRL